MGQVRRVYVEKKPEFAVQAKALRHEIRHYLGIMAVTGVRELIRYDVENIEEDTFEKACRGVFAEPPVDFLYQEDFPRDEEDTVFSVEFLPGQFDQRADSAEQCVQFIKEDEKPVIKTAVTYVIRGKITEEELAAIKNHCINPVDSRETGLEKPETLVTEFEEPEDIKTYEGFCRMVMCLIFKVNQPFFCLSAYFDRNNNTACIDLIRFFLILKFSFFFQFPHRHQCQIHQTDKLVFAISVHILMVFHILLISLFDWCFIISLINLYLF